MIARSVLLSAALALILNGAAMAGDRGSSSSNSGGSNASSGKGNGSSNGNAGGNSASGNNGNGGSNSGSGNSGNGNGNGGSSNAGDNAGSTPAAPQVVAPGLCTLSDLSPGASACSGFYQGNLLNQSPADLLLQTQGLAAIGLSDWDGQLAEPQLNLSASSVDFATLLRGISYIGIHWGAGVGSPSPQTPGGVTAFYALNAGESLDVITLAFGSASGARLYSTQPAPLPPVIAPPQVLTPPPPPEPNGGAPGSIEDIRAAVPEPATWMLMILGFGGAGALLRRRAGQAAA